MGRKLLEGLFKMQWILNKKKPFRWSEESVSSRENGFKWMYPSAPMRIKSDKQPHYRSFILCCNFLRIIDSAFLFHPLSLLFKFDIARGYALVLHLLSFLQREFVFRIDEQMHYVHFCNFRLSVNVFWQFILRIKKIFTSALFLQQQYLYSCGG